MSIDLKRLRELAELAKIHLDEDRIALMEKDFDSIVALMDTLRDADIPSTYESAEDENAVYLSDLREDTVRDSLPVNILTGQSPTPGEFSIPKVVDSGEGGV